MHLGYAGHGHKFRIRLFRPTDFFIIFRLGPRDS